MEIQETKEKIMKATKKHFKNVEILSERKPSQEELEEMYSYLLVCWRCGKKITFWDKLTFNKVHSFVGNAHRRKCI